MLPAAPDLLGGVSRSDGEGQVVDPPIIAGPLSAEEAGVDLGSVRPQAFLPREEPSRPGPSLGATIVAIASHGVVLAILASSSPGAGSAGEAIEIPVEIVAAIPEPPATAAVVSPTSLPDARQAIPQTAAAAPAGTDPTPDRLVAEHDPESKGAAVPPAAAEPAPAPDAARAPEPSAPQASALPGDDRPAPADRPQAVIEAPPQPASSEAPPAPAYQTAEPTDASELTSEPASTATLTPSAGSPEGAVPSPTATPPPTARTPPRLSLPPRPLWMEPDAARLDHHLGAIPRQRVSTPTPSERRTAAVMPRTIRQPVGRNPDRRKVTRVASPAASPDAIAAYNRAVIERIAAAKHYPEQARERGAQGTVVVDFSLSAAGQVTSASVRRSSTDAGLDAEALSTVRHAGPFGSPPRGTNLTFSVPLRFSFE